MAFSSSPSSGVSIKPARYSSTEARSSSRLRSGIRDGTGSDELGLDLLRELGELGDHVHGSVGVDLLRPREALELRASLVELREQLLRATEMILGGGQAAASSRAILPRMPFTSRAASSDAYRFASTTASLIATSGGTVLSSSS